MAKVFIPHRAMKLSASNRCHVPVIDMSDAEQFGKLVIVTESYKVLSVSASVQEEIKRAMADYEEGDFILSVGDPVAIAACAMVAAKKCEKVQFLKWDRFERKYFPEEVVV